MDNIYYNKYINELEILYNQFAPFASNDVYCGKRNALVQPCGLGKMNFSNGDIYDGEWKDGKRDGQGSIIYSNKDIYSGQWVDDKKSCQGKMIFSNGHVYEGEWKVDKFDGIGSYISVVNGIKYEGEWKNGMRCGKGKQVENDDCDARISYTGEWENDKREGNNVLW